MKHHLCGYSIDGYSSQQEATLGAGDVLYLSFGDLVDMASRMWSNIATIFLWAVPFDDGTSK